MRPQPGVPVSCPIDNLNMDVQGLHTFTASFSMQHQPQMGLQHSRGQCMVTEPSAQSSGVPQTSTSALSKTLHHLHRTSNRAALMNMQIIQSTLSSLSLAGFQGPHGIQIGMRICMELNPWPGSPANLFPMLMETLLNLTHMLSQLRTNCLPNGNHNRPPHQLAQNNNSCAREGPHSQKTHTACC